MMRQIKRALYAILGQATYLKVLHSSFSFLYKAGLLKGKAPFEYHYFVQQLVHPGDTVVDLGANLGYYSRIFSRLVGKNGRVICIEPVKPFFRVLSWALKQRKNCTLYNYALGLEQKQIEMIIPKGTHFRTGLAHVPTSAYDENDVIKFEVEMVKGSDLLSDLSRLDFIKCDIEGYEEYVFPEIREVIRKHKPIIQIETWGTHKEVIFRLMQELEYIRFGVEHNKLIRELPESEGSSDYIFIHQSAAPAVIDRLKKTGHA